MVLLIILCALLLVLVGFLGFLLKKSLERSRHFEDFYESTLDDVEVVIESFNDLMKRRQLISDDPDVKNLYRSVTIFHGILVGYANARKQPKQRGTSSPQ
jgi:uncharacterized protein YoxC